MHEPVDPPYLLQLILPLSPEITESAWRNAWKWVVRAQSILRLGYAGGNCRVAAAEAPPEWRTENLSHLRIDLYRKETQKLFKRERQTGFDVSVASRRTLCRCLWVHPPANEVPFWCLTIHHALIDGNSLAPLVAQIIRALENCTPILPESLFWARARQVQETDWKDAREYFRLSPDSPIPAGDLREYLPRNENLALSSDERHRVPIRIDAELQRQIDSRMPFGPDTLVHAAWSLVLSRITDSNAIVFGVTCHCRGQRSEGLYDAIGPFSNVLPLHIEVPDDVTTASWLGAVRNAWLALKPHECCPLREIRLAGLEETHEVQGLQSLVNVVREPPAKAVERMLGTYAAGRPVFYQKTDIPISLSMHTQPTLGGTVIARSDAFSPDQTRMFASLFKQALRQIISVSTHAVGELSVLSSSDRDTGRSPCVERLENSVLELLHHIVATQGDALALSTSSRSMDFRELWQRAGSFAAELEFRGVQPEDIVAILTGRSIDTVIAMIGSLRAGAAFFIVDKELPSDRQIESVRAAGCCFLFSHQDTADTLLDQPAGLVHLLPSEEIQAAPRAVHTPQPGDLAYLVATSGTTGSPNIVMIEHGSLVNMLQGYAIVLKPHPGDVRYQSVPASSDTFILEVMLYLGFGACLHIDPGLMDSGLSRFDQALRQRGVTVLGLPSSLWREWAEYQINQTATYGTGDESLRAVICSMERTDPVTLRAWRERNGRGQLWINAYGPSEATCVTCLFTLEPGDVTPEGEVPIGKPLPNTQVYVVDSRQRQLPVGVIGEIAIGGTGVGRRYVNSSGLTSEKFVIDPFSPNRDARLYLTGDLAYFHEDGNLVFVGRSDNQVKIRGHRIELEAVDLSLLRIPEVHDAAAVAVSQDRSVQLTAFYSAGKPLDVRVLRSHLIKYLSPASMPHRFVKREIIPRDRLGKVSRHLLVRDAENLANADTRATTIPPEWNASDALQTRLNQLFGRVLDNRIFDEQGDFFHSGGDSLRALVLLSEIEKNTGHVVSITDLFLHSSPARLAAYLEGRRQPCSSNCLVPISPGGQSAPLLFFHGFKGDLFQQLPLARALGVDRPVWGIQAVELAGQERDPSVEVMGARYAAEILNVCDSTPSYLCGYSAGGIIAFETARQLLEQGFPIKRLLVIDSIPFNLPMITHLNMYSAHLRERTTFHCKALLREHDDIAGYMRARISGLRKLIAKGGRPSQVQHQAPVTATEGHYYGALVSLYCPRPAPVEVTLFQSTAGFRDPSAGWRYLTTRGLKVIPVPWQHLSIMQEEALDDLAALFRVALED